MSSVLLTVVPVDASIGLDAEVTRAAPVGLELTTKHLAAMANPPSWNIIASADTSNTR
jgi:hypothetical protein